MDIHVTEIDVLRQLGYTPNKISDIVSFKFGFEITSGQAIDYVDAAMLYDKFGSFYDRPAAYYKFVSRFYEKQGKNVSPDEIVATITNDKDLDSIIRLIRAALKMGGII